MIILQNQWKTNACLQNQYLSWKIYLFLVKKIAFMSSTQKWLFHSAYFWDWGMKKDVFCGINFCDVGILWKKKCVSQCFNKYFSSKSKKEDIYMGIIYMSFLSRNLLCKIIDTMSSFMWSNELFSILKCYTCIEFFI